MILVDFLVALVAPLFIPALNYVLGLAKLSGKVVVTPNGNPRYIHKTPVFILELPSAYIGNAIWGFTYRTNDYSETTVVWMTVYGFVSLGCLIYQAYSRTGPNHPGFAQHMKYFGAVLVFLTIVRISTAYIAVAAG